MSTLQSRPRRNELKEYIDRKMTIKHLRILTAIAKYGKLSEAAQSLNTTTSNISKTLKEIDEFIGERLFVRNSGYFKETDTSRHLLKLAHEFFRAMENTKHGLDEAARQTTKTAITIGYRRTLLSSRAHALWNQLVFSKDPTSVLLTQLSSGEHRGSDIFKMYQNIDIVFSSENLEHVLRPPSWRTFTHSFGDLLFIMDAKQTSMVPRYFFLPACAKTITDMLQQHIQAFYPNAEAISYYDSAYNTLDSLRHPGTGIMVERRDYEHLAQYRHLHVVHTLKDHDLRYFISINLDLLTQKGILNNIEQTLPLVQ